MFLQKVWLALKSFSRHAFHFKQLCGRVPVGYSLLHAIALRVGVRSSFEIILHHWSRKLLSEDICNTFSWGSMSIWAHSKTGFLGEMNTWLKDITFSMNAWNEHRKSSPRTGVVAFTSCIYFSWCLFICAASFTSPSSNQLLHQFRQRWHSFHQRGSGFLVKLPMAPLQVARSHCERL